MKYHSLATFLCLSILLFCCKGKSSAFESNIPDAPTAPIDSTYTLVWQDNFDGNTLNETNNWHVEVNGDGGGNSELQYYKRENISVGAEPTSGSNCLIIKAKKEPYLSKNCTSGRLTTQDKVMFKYGKLEARIKLPNTANGLWPAFWLLGNDISLVSWPKCGEIDILEAGAKEAITNGTQDRWMSGACHWGPGWDNGNHRYYAKASTSSTSLSADFHLYTIIWDSRSVKFYLDQDKNSSVAPYFEMLTTPNANEFDPYRYFNKPFFILFNLAVGGNFPQIWDINQITALQSGEASMYIDYVRLYQMKGDGEQFNGPILH